MTQDTHFVGRAADLAGMLDAVQDRPSLIYVEGTAGSGKTRLVAEFVRANAADPQVLVRRCVRLDRSRERDLIPELAPGVIVIEDLQWADAETLDSLRLLLSRPAPGVVVVLTFRPGELPVSGLPLGPGWSPPPELARRTIRLDPLTPADVHALAEAMLGDTRASWEYARRLHERTAGLPGLVAEVLRAASAGEVAPDPGRIALPVALHEHVSGQLAALAEDARRVVRAAAVLAEPADERTLAAVADLPEARHRVALLRALRSEVLIETAPGYYGFAIPLVCEHVYGGLPGPDRQAAHRRVAQALLAESDPPAVRLAHHYRAAGQRREWLRHLATASDAAMSDGDPRTAISLLQQALTDSMIPRATRVDCALKLARCAVMGLDPGESVALLSDMLTDSALPPAVRGEIRLDLGLILANQGGRTCAGLTAIDRAIPELVTSPALAARAMSVLAMPAWPGSHVAENLARAEFARELAGEAGDPVMDTAVLVNAAAMLIDIGARGAWETIEAFPVSAESLDERGHLGRGFCNFAYSAVLTGHYHRAHRYLVDGRDLLSRTGALYPGSVAEGTALLLDWALGDWDGLVERATRLTARATQLPRVAADGHVVLGMLALAKGDWAECEAQFAAAGLTMPDDATLPTVSTASAGRVRMLLALDDLPGAAEESQRAWERLRQKGVWGWAAELAPAAVEATIRHSGQFAARRMIAEFAGGIEGCDLPLAHACLRCCMGVYAEHTGDLSAAVENYTEAARLYARLSRPYDVALARESWARCQILDGDGSALAELSSAAKEFEGLGATWDTARCHGLLRRNGSELGPRRGRRGYGSDLSPRERQVAELAASGRTSREIATVLVLSPRTVEHHVSQAMRKLGVNTRDALGDVLPES